MLYVIIIVIVLFFDIFNSIFQSHLFIQTFYITMSLIVISDIKSLIIVNDKHLHTACLTLASTNLIIQLKFDQDLYFSSFQIQIFNNITINLFNTYFFIFYL